MGQILSNLDDGEEVEAAEEAGMIDLRKQALDAKRVATLSWPEFVEYINGLNERCKGMMDDQGKYLMFAVRKGSTDTYLWKATAQICCMKYNTMTNKPETFKCMTLSKFLRIYSTLIGLINERPDVDGLETASASSCDADRLMAWSQKFDLNASMLMDKVDALESLDAKRQESAGTECIVCMERQPDVVLPCSHAYCLPCIEQWNVNNHDCPTCRADIRSTDEAWVISDYPDKQEFTDYLFQLTD